jgi:hypothetical protein
VRKWFPLPFLTLQNIGALASGYPPWPDAFFLSFPHFSDHHRRKIPSNPPDIAFWFRGFHCLLIFIAYQGKVATKALAEVFGTDYLFVWSPYAFVGLRTSKLRHRFRAPL